MKKHFIATILILLICIVNVAFAQPQNLKGIWVSAEQDLIEIRNLGRDSSNTVANKLLHEEYFHLFIVGDTLSFRHIYTSSATDFKIEYTDRYDLKIVKSNDSILVVKPVSKLSKAYFQDRPVLTLKKKDYLTDKTMSLKNWFTTLPRPGPARPSHCKLTAAETCTCATPTIRTAVTKVCLREIIRPYWTKLPTRS